MDEDTKKKLLWIGIGAAVMWGVITFGILNIRRIRGL